MSFAPDTWHPLARYGVALLVHEETDELLGEETARVHAAAALIEEALTTFMIAPAVMPAEAAETVTYHYHADAKPGKANGQISANGYFSAPHVVTGNNAADIVKEARARVKEASKPKRLSSVELKKSFAPTVSKINAGSKSMSNPRVGFEEALFTALASLHPLKPAAYDYDIGSNVAIVPDLPLDELGAYLRVVAKLLRNMGARGLGRAIQVQEVRTARPVQRQLREGPVERRLGSPRAPGSHRIIRPRGGRPR